LSPQPESHVQLHIAWPLPWNFIAWSLAIMPADLFLDLDHLNSHQPLAKIAFWLLLAPHLLRFVTPLAKAPSFTDVKAINVSVLQLPSGYLDLEIQYQLEQF
jgi:hypothetical protein